MKRCCLLLASSLLLVTFTLRAEEPPQTQLEFIRKLRDKGYADLALEYLEKLQKNPPAALKVAIPMELARTRIALARDKEPGQRLALLNTARQELEAFIKANANRPESAQARFELAGLATQQGKALLSKALRREDLKSQQDEAKKAEQQFIQAAKELEAAAVLLKDLAGKYKNPDATEQELVRQQLAQDELQARFERGMTLMEQARTYLDLSGDLNTKRATVIDDARKVFEKVAEQDDTNPTSLLAAAWLVRCYQEGQDPTKAKKAFETVMFQKTKVADTAKRWARYFHMQGIMKDPTFKFADKKIKVTDLTKVQEIEREALDWLKAYPSHKNSLEGQGVRFELANAYIRQAGILSPKDPRSLKVAPLYNKAQKELLSLAQGDSDVAEQANQLNLSLSFLRMGADTPIAKLKDFEECYLKANYEMYLMKKVGAQPGDLEKQEKERTGHLKNMIQAFTRALQLADAKTPPQKTDEARFYLATGYLLAGDAFRAAVAGEDLAREKPPHKRSPAAAGYAIEAYASILTRDNTPDNHERLLDLANFVLKDRQKAWKSDPVTPVARFFLARAFQRDDKYKEAIAQFEQLTPDYPGFVYAQGQLVFTALEARTKAKTDAEKRFFQDKAVLALKRMPKLPPDSDPATATVFFLAQLEYPKLLYFEAAQDLAKPDKANVVKAAVKYREMAAYIKQLQDQFAKTKLPAETGQKVAFSMRMLEKFTRLGLAETEYRAGNYDKVLTPNLAGGTVAEVKKLGAAPGQIQLPDYKVTGDILGLALRAYVQTGKIEEAKGVLHLLQRLTSTEGLEADPTAVLRSLIQELELQVRTLQKANDPEALKKTTANFSAFVDELAKSPGKKGLQATDYFFLARLYDSLDQHCKAAELYSKITEPKDLNKKLAKGEKFAEQEEKEIQTYWYSQVQYARQLRQCPENKDENLELANKLLYRLLTHPNARGQVLAEKERIHVVEESGRYGPAINLWDKFLKNPAVKSRLGDDQNTKEMYFDAYYHYAYCAYRYSQDPKAKSAKTWLRRAADSIVRLEKAKDNEGWQLIGPRFQELLENEPPLRAQYEQLKKTAK